MIYCCSDFHGCIGAFTKIKEFIKENDTVYFLGDAADRGMYGWEIIKEILADKRFIYLKGNHEDMLVNAYREVQRYQEMSDECSLLFDNGGRATFHDLLRDPDRVKIINQLDRLDSYKRLEMSDGSVIHLSHAGFTYNKPEEERNYIWDRAHFQRPDVNIPDNEYIIHGHTPIPFVVEYLDKNRTKIEPGALWYNRNRKCCVDCGTFATGYTVLLCLDNFTEEIFEV